MQSMQQRDETALEISTERHNGLQTVGVLVIPEGMSV